MPPFNDFMAQQQTEKENLFLSHAPKEALRYFVEWSHWYGVACAERLFEREQKSDGPMLIVYLCTPDYEKLHLTWFTWYGTIAFGLLNEDGIPPVNIADLKTYTLVGQREYILAASVTHVAGIINQFALSVFPGLTIRQNWCMCDGPHVQPFNGICKPIGDKWLCEDCINRWLLPAPESTFVVKMKTDVQIERGKMTPSLRFKILQRDSFTCKGCGRSPLRDSSVELRIDHIHPVAHGGKTEENNLQVLCFECNAGKSDRLAPEMVRAV